VNRSIPVRLDCHDSFIEFWADHEGSNYVGRLVEGVEEYNRARAACEEQRRAPLEFAGPPPAMMEIELARVLELGRRYGRAIWDWQRSERSRRDVLDAAVVTARRCGVIDLVSISGGIKAAISALSEAIDAIEKLHARFANRKSKHQARLTALRQELMKITPDLGYVARELEEIGKSGKISNAELAQAQEWERNAKKPAGKKRAAKAAKAARKSARKSTPTRKTKKNSVAKFKGGGRRGARGGVGKMA
jgi:hypothetical protein